MKKYKDSISKIRGEVIANITAIFHKFNTETLPLSVALDSGDLPVLFDGGRDENTYTLDSIDLRGNELLFEGSSSWDNIYLWDSQLDTDTLLEINDYLEENYEDIAEYLDGEDM